MPWPSSPVRAQPQPRPSPRRRLDGPGPRADRARRRPGAAGTPPRRRRRRGRDDVRRRAASTRHARGPRCARPRRGGRDLPAGRRAGRPRPVARGGDRRRRPLGRESTATATATCSASPPPGSPRTSSAESTTIAEATGTTPRIYRPPYGIFTPPGPGIVARRGLASAALVEVGARLARAGDGGIDRRTRSPRTSAPGTCSCSTTPTTTTPPGPGALPPRPCRAFSMPSRVPGCGRSRSERARRRLRDRVR